jgi:hypothetical protein
MGFLLDSLCSVLGSSLFSSIDTEGIERAANDMVADAGEVADASAADKDDGVFLEIVSFAADIGCDFFAVGEANASDFSEGRVRLLGGDGSHL